MLLFFLANYLAGRIVAPLEEKEEIWVNGNSVELKQLISILIDNGIRHGSQGKEVCLELKRVKNSAVLSVANEGREIPEEQRKHLFERFYRRDQAAEANVCRVKYEKSVSSIKLQSSLCTTGSAKVQGEFLCGWSIYFQKNTFIKLLFPNMELLTSP